MGLPCPFCLNSTNQALCSPLKPVPPCLSFSILYTTAKPFPSPVLPAVGWGGGVWRGVLVQQAQFPTFPMSQYLMYWKITLCTYSLHIALDPSYEQSWAHRPSHKSLPRPMQGLTKGPKEGCERSSPMLTPGRQEGLLKTEGRAGEPRKLFLPFGPAPSSRQWWLPQREGRRVERDPQWGAGKFSLFVCEGGRMLTKILQHSKPSLR